MKKTISYLAIASCFVLGVSLAQAGSPEKCGPMHDGQMHGQMHGQMEDKMFKGADADGDGAISKAEFDAFHAIRFKEMDANGDGRITPDEMKSAHMQMLEKGKDKRFDEADANHDGALSREETEKMPMMSRRFEEIDANHDGKVTREEMDAVMEKRRYMRDKK